MSDVLRFLVNRIERTKARINALQVRAAAPTEAEKNALASLKLQLSEDEKTLTDLDNLFSRRGGPKTVLDYFAYIGGAPAAPAYEQDWRDVFHYFPGMRARFTEIIAIDEREIALWKEYMEKGRSEILPIADRTTTEVKALWTPFKADVQRSLTYLSEPRRVSLTFQGTVVDDDNFSDDEIRTINEVFSSTIRFGPAIAYSTSWPSDSVRLDMNFTYRLVVGAKAPALGSAPNLELAGEARFYDGDDHKGTAAINATLSPGQDTGVGIGQHDDDYAECRIRYDLL
jgi:hypothetical protein